VRLLTYRLAQLLGSALERAPGAQVARGCLIVLGGAEVQRDRRLCRGWEIDDGGSSSKASVPGDQQKQNAPERQATAMDNPHL
jgi:hypothetical protein